MTATSTVLPETMFPGNEAAFTELVTFMKSGLVTALTGAGVSVPLFPTWVPLLGELISDATKTGILTDNSTIDEYRKQVEVDPLELAGTLEESFTRKVFRAKLAKTFSNSSGECTDTHKTIAELKCRGIVTLNYDDGHEVAYARCGRKPNSGRSQDESTLTRWLQGEAFDNSGPPILHLHGEPSDPEGMIITADDYDRFYQSSLPDTFIKQLWRSERLLVVGFGFSDPFLTRVAQTTLRSLSSDTRHFAFIGQNDGESVTPYQRQLFAKKYRLTPIFYVVRQTEIGGKIVEDHSDLERLLKKLPKVDVITSTTGAYPQTTSSTAVIALGQEDSLPQAPTPQNEEIDFRRDLFVSPHGTALYVEPRLVANADVVDFLSNVSASVSIADLVNSTQSYIIAARPECGATTLAKRIVSEVIRSAKRPSCATPLSYPIIKKSWLMSFQKQM